MGIIMKYFNNNFDFIVKDFLTTLHQAEKYDINKFTITQITADYVVGLLPAKNNTTSVVCKFDDFNCIINNREYINE